MLLDGGVQDEHPSAAVAAAWCHGFGDEEEDVNMTGRGCDDDQSRAEGSDRS
jgi:hypothetical protein